MKNQLQKAINLSKKTGDRLIVFDLNQGLEPFVVMDLAEYEKIIIGKSEVRGLTEGELVDKINRDIAVWRSEQAQENEHGSRPAQAGSGAGRRLGKGALFTPVKDIIAREPDEYPFFAPGFDDEDGEEDNGGEEYGVYGEEQGRSGRPDDYREYGRFAPGMRPNPWRIPPERKQAAEEVIDEDLQYLEKI